MEDITHSCHVAHPQEHACTRTVFPTRFIGVILVFPPITYLQGHAHKRTAWVMRCGKIPKQRRRKYIAHLSREQVLGQVCFQFATYPMMCVYVCSSGIRSLPEDLGHQT